MLCRPTLVFRPSFLSRGSEALVSTEKQAYASLHTDIWAIFISTPTESSLLIHREHK